MALTDDRNTPIREGDQFQAPVKSGMCLFAGAIVALAAGVVRPGYEATGLRALGIADERADNTAGEDGDIAVKYRKGVARLENSADADEITVADVGNVAYIVDDATVAKTSATNTRSPAGVIVDVDADGVWVAVGFGPPASPGGDVLAANNLSDVGSAATSRANLGANKVAVNVNIATLVGTGVTRVVSPVAGTIKKIWSVIDGALATGDATVTASIGGVAVTNGALTVTQAGSAAGDVDSATPTAARTVAAGDVIALTVGGTNTAARAAQISIEIET